MQGKVALVTGGASGIGEAVGELLAREGASVVVTDIDELEWSRGGQARITRRAARPCFLEQDVTSEERWIEVVAEIEKRFGRLDVMVSNAGIGIAVPSITEMSLADWRRQTAINLDGVFLSVKHCLPLMRKTGGGSIIMMSSLAGLRGSPACRAIAPPRAACGCSRNRSRWNAPASATASASTRCIPASSTRRSGARSRRERPASARTRRSIPRSAPSWLRRSGRAGQAHEIASGVLYLASDASRYVTGSELVIDGGMYRGWRRA